MFNWPSPIDGISLEDQRPDHSQFYGGCVNGNISSANFGQIVNAASPRLVQLAGKFVFLAVEDYLLRRPTSAAETVC